MQQKTICRLGSRCGLARERAGMTRKRNAERAMHGVNIGAVRELIDALNYVLVTPEFLAESRLTQIRDRTYISCRGGFSKRGRSVDRHFARMTARIQPSTETQD
jgi:hypothetical protein